MPSHLLDEGAMRISIPNFRSGILSGFIIFFCGWDSGMWYAIVRIFRGPIRSFVYRPGRQALTWTARRSVNAADAADGGVESRLVSAIAAGEVPIDANWLPNAIKRPKRAIAMPCQCHAWMSSWMFCATMFPPWTRVYVSCHI